MAMNFKVPVLVIDDSETITRIVRGLLGQIGFKNVDEANSGGAALETMADKKYGLIISDWHMTFMSGLQFLKQVRADPNYRNVPFIMVTGDAKAELVIAAKKAGVDGYIVKPFTAETLKAKINEAMLFDYDRAGIN